MRKNNLSRLAKVFFLVFLPLLIIVFSRSDVVKAGDVSNNISSLTVSSNEITDGGQTTVKFTFDEHAQKIQPGDTLKVNWTSSGTVFGVGFKKTIPLSIDGTYVGDMVITDGSATVTFNEAIRNLQNIRGWGEFEIEGHNNTATDKEHVGKFTIISGVKTVDLNVKKMATGVNSAPFYLKAGDMHADDPEHILWVLTINAMNLEVDGDVRVEDEVQGGHKLVPDSFKITTTGNKPGYYSGATAIEDFKAAFPGSTFTVDASGKFVVTIPKDLINKTGVLIFYRTKVEIDAQKHFKNNTKVWYQVKGETAVVAKEVNASVANINANGGVDGDQTSTTSTTTTTEEPKTTSTTTTTTEEPKTTSSTTTTTEEPKTTSSTTTTTEEPKTTSSTTTTTEEPKTTSNTTTTTEEPKTTSTTITTTEEPKTTSSTTTTTEEPKTTSSTTTTTEEPKTTSSTTTTTEEPKSTVTTTEAPTTSVTTTEEPAPAPAPTTTTTPSSSSETTTEEKPGLPFTGESKGTLIAVLGSLVLVSSIIVLAKTRKTEND